MIKLYSFGPHFGVAYPSPFVLKVDAYLRMAGIEFENISDPNNLSRAPKGKLPFIDDQGELIADSQFIFTHFQDNPQTDLDLHLNDQQKAIAYLTAKSLDENLYFVLVYSRWLRDDTWPIIKQAFFNQMPFPLKHFVPNMIRKTVLKGLKGQGIARHSNTEIQNILRCSLKALTTLLGDKKYFFGDQPSSLDAAAFGFLAEFMLTEIDNPFNQIAKDFTTLMSYCERINGQYYG